MAPLAPMLRAPVAVPRIVFKPGGQHYFIINAVPLPTLLPGTVAPRAAGANMARRKSARRDTTIICATT